MKIAEVMDHNVRRRNVGARKGDPKVQSLHIEEGAEGGHVVEHHFAGPEYKEAEKHPFPASTDKIKLPANHVLTHIATHMNIPHEVTNAERGLKEAPNLTKVQTGSDGE